MSKRLAIAHLQGKWFVVAGNTMYGPFDTKEEAAQFASQLSMEAL